jgi:hypothetical protein
MREVRPRSKRLLVLGGGGLLLVGFLVSRFVCVGAWLRYGVVVPACPDGLIRQTLAVDCRDLRRGGTGTGRIEAFAVYTTGEADAQQVVPLGRYEPSLALVKEKGEEIPLVPAKGWQKEEDARVGTIALPRDLPDGDYQLRARVRSPLGEDKVDVPLAVYAPARVHVITDRPLYEPGNTVQFRAVVLRATDFAPVDNRPGKWIVEDPSGETVLEEKAPAGVFGVVSGSFPLDSGAPTGAWKVRWTSGGAEDTVGFRVEPFTLPRFHVEAAPVRPFHRAGDHPVVKGRALYSSGAPVRNATVEIGWTITGEWPPPTDWQQGGLPNRTVTDGSGAFELHLPVVPRDLRGAGDAGGAGDGHRRDRRPRGRQRRRPPHRARHPGLGRDRARGWPRRGLQQPRLPAGHQPGGRGAGRHRARGQASLGAERSRRHRDHRRGRRGRPAARPGGPGQRGGAAHAGAAAAAPAGGGARAR